MGLGIWFDSGLRGQWDGEHAELAGLRVQALHPNTSDDLSAQPGHGDLVRADKAGDLIGLVRAADSSQIPSSA